MSFKATNESGAPLYGGRGEDLKTFNEYTTPVQSQLYGKINQESEFDSNKDTWLSPDNLWTDLSLASAATINQLRQAFAVQRLYERDALGGTRYTEMLRAHFGVTSSDARLQRPEYLGGKRVPINITQVIQQSATNDTSPQEQQQHIHLQSITMMIS